MLNAAKVSFILCLFSTLRTGAGLLSYDFSELENATTNFSRENKIGEGGSGQVYQVEEEMSTTKNSSFVQFTLKEIAPLEMGLLQGSLVAIKKCFEESCPERSSDFANEIRFIPLLQHKNIVKLLGYCTEANEKAWYLMFMEDAPKKLNQLVHPSLYCERGPRAEHITTCVHIALLCVQEDPADRPSMKDVVLMLNGGASMARQLVPPKKPAHRYGDGKMMPTLAELLRDDLEQCNKTMVAARAPNKTLHAHPTRHCTRSHIDEGAASIV
ncbi:hypothetical protein PR202_gb12305 [Eleusine coracana subsp. coracana]|uniref:Protein kinase domain-containing protein n=1 Tax=Eleusine coracana subsp. coracana TaxID=191504 RepID=A0AAV5EP12_ELECO|nr:hypothetical protein PR202_gb12305 [Eleusine coracana subsp. coracana]